MKKNRINTTSIREIKNSFKRFLSLLVMSMLGVGVFVGIKMSAPDMMKSVDKYYDQNNVYDIKLVSTLGLTGKDIKEIKKIKNVKEVKGSYSKDVLIKTKNDEAVIKVTGISNDINKIELLKGRMPKNNKEIVVEKSMLRNEKLKLGDKVSLLDDNTFKEKELTIVGVVKSPLYITNSTSSTGRGNTTIGTGKINYYTYVNSDNFNLNYYTEIYLTLDDAKEKTTNSKDYMKIVNETIDDINKIKDDKANERYNEIYNDIKSEIDKNEEDGLNKLAEGKKLLDENGNKLKDAKNVLNDSKSKLDSASLTLNNSKNELDNNKKLLDDTKIKLNSSRKEIDTARDKLNSELASYSITIEDIEKTLEYVKDIELPKDTVIGMIPDDAPYHDEVIDAIDKIYEAGLQDKINDFIKNPDIKDEIINSIPADTPGYDDIVGAINKIPSDEEIKEYLENNANIDTIISSIPSDTPGYDDIIKTLTFYKENKDKFNELVDAIKMIEDAEIKYSDGLAKYNDGLSKYNEGYNSYLSYYNDLQNNLSLYNNSLNTYNSNLNLYNTKVKEYYDSKSMFDLQIAEAKKQLDKIPLPKWFVYNRLDDTGYSNFIDDGNSISNLAKVFPTIFFIVAVLISLISMSRMVEDDRMVIGTFKSLGFSNKHIRKKYLLYSGVATILGGIIGSLLGFFLLPKFIWNIYKILFDIPVFKYDFNPTNTIIGLTIAVICICGTTLLTIRKVVKEKPSDLMRPKAPENGKRVILERISFIWNNLNFSNKVTVRNLFRYKKRVLMTVGGILGCTALMLSGFGIRDSVVNIPSKQYGDIYHFDEMVYLTDDIDDKTVDNIFDNEYIKNNVDVQMNVSMTSGKYDINIFIPKDESKLSKVLNLEDLKSDKKLKLVKNKVIISDKLADLENKKVGDKIKLTDSENNEYEFIISGICKNYVGHYVFMDKETYEENIGEYKTNIVYLNLKDLKHEEEVSKQLVDNKNVMSIISSSYTIGIVDDMLKSLNSVVLILIVLSGSLSFVVLYNLSYINISERKREIATLKVLGFTDKEVDNYITKETIILTIIGIFLGLIFGIFLTGFIIDTVEIEMVRFLHHVKPISFIITSALVMIFTLIVNRIIHFALKKIDMIESLKSVE